MANATPPPGFQMTVVSEIRQLVKAIETLETPLRQHQQALRQRAMSLPSNFLPDIQRVRTELEGVAANIEEAQTELQRLRALSDTFELINSTLDLGDVLNRVMDTVIQLTGAERGYLVLRDENTKEMEFRVARNIEQRSLGEGEFIVSSTIVSDVARTGQPIVTTNAATDSRFSAHESIVNFALRSILCVPLILKGEVTGVIYADNRIRSGLFGAKELSLLHAFANQAAIAIENARLFEQLKASIAEISEIRDLMDNVFSSIASGVITTSADDAIIILNNAASQILQVTLEHSRGRAIWEALPRLHEEFAKLIQMVRQQEIFQSVEVEPDIPARGIVNLSLKLTPLRDVHQVTQGVAIVVDDLTELKQREAQLNVVRRYLPPAMVDNITSIDKLALGGERRLITTCFIDVRGFPSFPPNLRPTELMEMLNVYLTIASDAVTKQNGVIDKYMANEIMGLFNTQLNPDEDHVWRAVVAALNMVEEYNQFYQTGVPGTEGAPFYRIGIHTGVATLGNTGSETRKEFTAIGDSVNLAHRLLENAHPGQIIISDDTYQHCKAQLDAFADQINVIPGADLQVKGRRQLTRIYEVQRRVN